MTFVVAALYHFFDFPHFAEMRAPLLARMKELQVKGSLLLASEGINGTVGGSRDGIDHLLDYLKTTVICGDFEYKESSCENPPFIRSKVRLKKETISLGEPVSLQKFGHYVDARAWNALLDAPDTIIIDARNAYEVHLGSFEGAFNPDTKNFKELPAVIRTTLKPEKNQKIATFCTGGIRCEKFTSWLIDQGYEEVYHLKGGILKYLEEIPPEESKWHGECYVFDKRIAVGHGLIPTTDITACYCGHPLTPEDRTHSAYKAGEKCGYCSG